MEGSEHPQDSTRFGTSAELPRTSLQVSHSDQPILLLYTADNVDFLHVDLTPSHVSVLPWLSYQGPFLRVTPPPVYL